MKSSELDLSWSQSVDFSWSSQAARVKLDQVPRLQERKAYILPYNCLLLL